MLTVLHQDEELIAVHKPAGLLVHRSALDAHETRFALQLVRDQIGAPVYPVHRLDKATSGVLLFARSPDVAARCRVQFEAGRVAKRYVAIVRGHPPRSGRIEHALDREDHQGKAAGVRQPAITDYRLLATTELPIAVDRYPTSRYGLVELEPRTGRRHQLRRHMKHIAHPIIGDTTHGHGAHNRVFRDRFECHRLLLVALAIELALPSSGARLCIETRADEDFQRVADAIGLTRRPLDAAAHEPANPALPE